MNTHFKAPWGQPLRWISALVTLLLLSISLQSLARLHGHPVSMSVLTGLILPLSLLVGSALFIIRGYTVTADTLLIHRLLWDTVVPLAQLQSVEHLPNFMSKSLRSCGNGGLYSFTGWYWNKPLGHYRAFVSDLKRTVVLCFATRRIVISPDDPGRFIEATKTHLTPP